MKLVQGIHHITAIGSNAQELVDFYTKVLGLRFVKKTVNQDDTATYHLFFGDRFGEPGMDLTFFTFTPPLKGISGVGLVTTISLAIEQTALNFWLKRFEKLNINHEPITKEFNYKLLRFYGPDNLKLELVGVSASKIHKNQSHIWSTPHISTNNAIRHFHSATLTVSSLELIEPVLTKVLGYKKINTQHQSVLYQASGNHRAIFLKVEVMPQLEPGFNASGTVHHIAFGVNNEAEQLKVRSLAIKAGMFPTPVINRYYFKSVYFRTPAGILFEIATNGPGFLVDQTEAELGHKLALPPFLEPQRRIIESRLKPI